MASRQENMARNETTGASQAPSATGATNTASATTNTAATAAQANLSHRQRQCLGNAPISTAARMQGASTPNSPCIVVYREPEPWAVPGALSELPLHVVDMRTAIPAWWPNNIPREYIIVKDVGLCLRAEAMRWLVRGRDVFDNYYNTLTVKDIEDEQNPADESDAGVRRQTAWQNSFPPHYYMDTQTGEAAQPGIGAASHFPTTWNGWEYSSNGREPDN